MEKESPHPVFQDGPIKNGRHCTDILFLLLLLATWVGMVCIGLCVTGVIDSEYLEKGDPYRLLNGMDYHGNICGVTNYTNTNGDNNINLPKAYYLPSGSAICIQSCPEENDINTFYCKYETEALITSKTATMHAVHGEKAANKTKHSLYLYYTTIKQCMPQIKTRSYLGYCQPTILSNEISEELKTEFHNNNITSGTAVSLLQGNKEGGDFFDEAMADAVLARYVIFGFGLGGAMVLGFTYLLLMRTPGVLSTMVWSIISLIFASLIMGGHYMKETSIRWENEGLKESHEIKGIYVLSIISYSAAALWFIMICCIRKRILLAVGCIKAASSALSAMPLMMIYPIFQVCCFFAFLIPWGGFMTFLASSGEIEGECMCFNDQHQLDLNTNFLNNTLLSKNSTTEMEELLECDDGCFLYKSFAYSRESQYAGIYMLFSFFWTSQFIIAVGQLVVAMSISMWYFTKEKKNVGNRVFFKAVYLSSLYHLGTCAFGSLIIAIIQTIRSVIAYIEQKTSRLENKTAKILLKSLQCCMCMLEKCMKFVNKNAYIQTAIHGYSFCNGAKEAFFLILRNILRISAISLVSEFVLLLGKMFIVLSSTIGAYLYMDQMFADDLNGLYVATTLTFLASYATAEMFNEVFGMSISTILQCFVTDEEMHEPKDRFTPDNLAETIDTTQQSSTMSNFVHPQKENNKK